MPGPLSLSCPVCRAQFRGTDQCSRCGADLAPLMRLAVRAWTLRKAARRQLLSGAWDQAADLARQAQGLYVTSSGQDLVVLSEWLRASEGGGIPDF